jgi:Xaa-Pro aminopeptidase
LKDKHFRVAENAAKDFEVLCALLGISERQAGELAIRQWIQRNRNQVSLETWTEARSSVAPVNRALMNVQLTVVKAELKEILDILQVIKPEHELEILRKLQKLMPTAQAWVEETRDKELGEVLTAVAAKVTL